MGGKEEAGCWGGEVQGERRWGSWQRWSRRPTARRSPGGRGHRQRGEDDARCNSHYRRAFHCLSSHLDVVAVQVVPAAPFHPTDSGRLAADHVDSPAGLPERRWDILKREKVPFHSCFLLLFFNNTDLEISQFFKYLIL